MPPMSTVSIPSEDPPSKESTLPGTIEFLGTGNMAEALIKGLLAAGLVKPEQIWGSDPRPSRCQQLKQQYGICLLYTSRCV